MPDSDPRVTGLQTCDGVVELAEDEVADEQSRLSAEEVPRARLDG